MTVRTLSGLGVVFHAPAVPASSLRETGHTIPSMLERPTLEALRPPACLLSCFDEDSVAQSDIEVESPLSEWFRKIAIMSVEKMIIQFEADTQN